MDNPNSPYMSIMRSINFALQTSIKLGDTMKGIPNSPYRVRKLGNELDSLSQTLQSLRKQAGTTEANLSELSDPLDECGRVCERFQQEVIESPSRLDWDNLRSIGGTIDNFTQLLNGYKSTFQIAAVDMCDPHLTSEVRKSQVKRALDDLLDISKNIKHKRSPITRSETQQTIATAKDHSSHEASSVKACLSYCFRLLKLENGSEIKLAEARPSQQSVETPSFEEPSVIENISHHDVPQIFVSTNGKPICGISETENGQQLQVAGHLSNASIQSISKDWAAGCRNRFN